MEEIDTLFGGSNHVEKGGDLLQVDDPRVANHNGRRFASENRDIMVDENDRFAIGVARGSGDFGHAKNEIKMTSKTVISSQGRSSESSGYV